jgi:hypothetical protein
LKPFTPFLVVGFCVVLAGSARTQRVDRDATPRASSLSTTASTPPGSSVHGSGSTKSIQIAFGPYITQTGVGAGGANVSELYTAQGYSLFGYGMQSSLGSRVADEFTICAGRAWLPDTIKWLAYQTGAATTGTITSMELNVWDASPVGQVPGGQAHTGGNQMQSSAWTGVYRVNDTALSDTDRAIIEVLCDGSWLPLLHAGSYWLEVSAGGTLTSGPWAPVKVVTGQVPPTANAWTGLQSVSSGTFAQAFDSGAPAGSLAEPAGFLFQMEGGMATNGNVSFCTSKPSSLGCVPSLEVQTSTIVKSGSPPAIVTAAPVPGGSGGLPGILIWTKSGLLTTPVNTSFGYLCLKSFMRAGAFPATPGGSALACNGSYEWDLSQIAAGTASMLVGDSIHIQAWYRDPGFPPPGNANFTQGTGPLTVAASAPGDFRCPNPPLPPLGLSIAPSSAGAGATITATGLNFGTDVGDLKLLLADGIGFADVTAAAGSQLTANVFHVGATGTGAVTVIRGSRLPMLDQFVSAGGINSNSSLVAVLRKGAGHTFGSFTLGPASSNAVSASSGVPISGGLSVDLSTLTGSTVLYRLASKIASTGEYFIYEARIDFTGVPTSAQRAQHLASHLNTSFFAFGVSASAAGTAVRIASAGTSYQSLVVAGL